MRLGWKLKKIDGLRQALNVSGNFDNMRFKLTIITILSCQVLLSQNLRDTIYFKNFENFIHSTETLIKQSHRFSDTTASRRQKIPKSDSITFYAIEVKNILRMLDSIDRFFLSMGRYFAKGKGARSQDLSSPVAQLQCSYSHYIQNLRYARDSIPAIVKASLVLESHLKNGFSSSIYCPFIYGEVKLGPGLTPANEPVKKIVLPDSLRKED